MSKETTAAPWANWAKTWFPAEWRRRELKAEEPLREIRAELDRTKETMDYRFEFRNARGYAAGLRFALDRLTAREGE